MHRLMKRMSTGLLILALFPHLSCVKTLADTADQTGRESRKQFDEVIRPIVEKNCVSCHGPDKQKKEFRIDTLDPDLVASADAPHWYEVLKKLRSGEMPPEDEDQLSANELDQVTEWLKAELNRAAKSRKGLGQPTVMRRMTKFEYNNSLRDLLGIPIDFDTSIPADRVDAAGLVNNGEMLGISPMQLQIYMDTARNALRIAFRDSKKPKVVSKRIEVASAPFLGPFRGMDRFNIQPGRIFREKNGAFVRLGAPYLFSLPERKASGPFRIRCRVGGLPSPDGKNPRLQIWMGYTAPGLNYARKLLTDVEIKESPNNPAVVEFSGYLENFPQPRDENSSNNQSLIWFINADDSGRGDREEFVVLDYKFNTAFMRKAGLIPTKNKKLIKANQREIDGINKQFKVAMSEDPRLFIDWIEFEGQDYKTWPPKSRTEILFDSPKRNEDIAYIGEVIKRFASRAWRRPATTQEINRYLKVFGEFKPSGSFEDAMVDTLALVLSSPDFLYYIEPESTPGPRPLNANELASRLSFFLWAGLPDEPLRELARSGEILNSDILNKEVDRLLDDPRSKRFIRQFCQHWLDLDATDLVAVNPEYFPAFDDRTKSELRQETYSFFEYVLNNDRSCLDFLDSDYVMLNEKLAHYYGIKGVIGSKFRPVKVGPERKRGGLMTQAAFLMATSDGIEPNPIYRGKWVMARLLSDPPSPPPPDVPELDTGNPDFANMTLKEQLASHRDQPSCAQCHDKLDPWGLALEHYDATGRLRNTETVRQAAIPNVKLQAELIMGKRKAKKVLPGKPIHSEVTLPDGSQINDIASLKRYLKLKKRDQFARGLTEKLLTYSLGRSLNWSDDILINELTAVLADNDYKLRPLIKAIINSDPFLKKF